MVPLFYESKERLMVKLAEQARKGQETETVEYVGCMCCVFRVAVICIYIGVHITHLHTHHKAFLDHHKNSHIQI